MNSLPRFAGIARRAFCAITSSLLLALPLAVQAQVVSSGMTGTVTSDAGQPVAGATVTAVHVPTNATFTATTSPTGRYNLRSLVVGGPWTVTVTAADFGSAKRTDVITNLGGDVDVSFTLKGSDVVTMEAFRVTADSNELESSALIGGSLLTSQSIADKPTSERSLADMVSATPFVTLRSTFGDREESQITAVGQNNRYNSVLIDGARINDQFGLNGTGLASFFNPLSLDAIEQLSVQLSPYDVRYAGFTGAAINAVTKSGTNEFKGSVYYYFRGDSFDGVELQGANYRDLLTTGKKVVPALERRTYGATFGGPIIPDKLFFFLNYEDFKSVSAGRDPRFSTPSESAILARFAKYSADSGTDINWGNPVTNATSNTATDQKYIAKLDWNIMEGQRLSVRYSKTSGEVPQFGNFASSSFSMNGISGGGVTTSPDAHFYTQQRVEESYSAQLFSQWSPDFKTEIKYSQTTQDQLTPTATVAPGVYIFGVSGTDLLNGSSTDKGVYIDGVEQFRHGNVIGVDSKQFSATGDYFWRDFVFSAGVEREQTDFYNLFRQGSYGLVAFRTLNDFLNDTNAIITRNVYDPSARPVADVSDFATNGLFSQVQWDVTPRLNLVLGLRYEFQQSSDAPALNQTFVDKTGFRNDGTIDGASSLSPRVGFSLALNEERTRVLKGGIGHFLGRAPWVFFSNSYGNTGVGSFTLSSAQGELPTSFTDYLKNNFDPANPIGTGVDKPSLRREVDWTDNDIEMPSVWRGNLRFEQKVSFLDTVLSAEIVGTQTDKALFIRNENLKPSTAASADGRTRFSGNPGTTANARYTDFTDLYHVSNVSEGESTYFTLSWERPYKDSWSFNAAYTRGHSVDAQAIGQTTASGQWQRNVVFNQGAVETGTSDFEIKDRIQLSASKTFNFVKRAPTTVSFYYEGRTGNPYSWVYSQDLNGDGRSDNDIVAVPDGASDARFDFSGLSADSLASYLAFIDASGLGKYAGGIAPKNKWTEPWVNRLDLKFAQALPVWGDKVKASLFLDFINFGAFLSKSTFGYTETAPGISNDVFRRRFLGGASYTAAGLIKPTYTATPADTGIDNGMSRWRIQLGAKLDF